MTKQEMFDKAYHGLASQGFERSLAYVPYIGGACAYRGEGGHRCAVGWLIPDEVYHPKMEGMDLYDVMRSFRVGLNDHDFLGCLRFVHDSSVTPLAMRLELCTFATRNGLTVPEVSQ